MTETSFIGRCDECFGLCCTALSFERSNQFGHDKLGGQPCQYLETDFRCRIHERREDLGYGGCEAFDCMGAGQRASAAFASLNWQRDAGVARQLHARFSQLLQLQELRQALETAAQLALSDDQHAQRRGLLTRVADDADSMASEPTGAGLTMIGEGRSFLRSLAGAL